MAAPRERAMPTLHREQQQHGNWAERHAFNFGSVAVAGANTGKHRQF
jgi:hypothetical protein